MIIVNQDKTAIYNFNNIQYIDYQHCVDEINRVYVNCEDITQTLGEYKTEERAKEILEEIINCCQCTEICYSGQRNYNPVNSIIKPIYYMPKE